MLSKLTDFKNRIKRAITKPTTETFYNSAIKNPSQTVIDELTVKVEKERLTPFQLLDVNNLETIFKKYHDLRRTYLEKKITDTGLTEQERERALANIAEIDDITNKSDVLVARVKQLYGSNYYEDTVKKMQSKSSQSGVAGSGMDYNLANLANTVGAIAMAIGSSGGKRRKRTRKGRKSKRKGKSKRRYLR
jgi:hypothetical protein